MTKKELQAVMILLGAVRGAASEVDSYCSDYDSSELKPVAKDLREAASEFRKTVKI